MALLKNYYNENDDSLYESYGIIWLAQTFTTTSTYYASSIRLRLYRTGSPGTTTVSLRATTAGKPSGADISGSTKTFNGDELTVDTDGEWKSISLAGGDVELTTGTMYAVIIRATTGGASNKINWRVDSAGSLHGSADACQSVNSGVAWASLGANVDFMYEVYGATAPTEKTYSKQLVAIGGNEVWYESTAGTMTELAAANGYINTLNPLNAASAFQKVFIANQTNLKVADFVNVKLVTSTLSATNPPDFGTTLVGTSGATMIVDYCSSLTAAANLYGQQTSAASFISTDTVTGTDDDGNAISFTLTAPQDDGPHWYDWTPYGNNTTEYGSMPSSAYIITRYRGRMVLAGHPDYPHQWYMSKNIEPWDWLYGTTDPMSATAGQNGLAGELGDVITALIPYGDDYLIIGCASSMHLMTGDPAQGGSIDELSNIVGIVGPNAWCKDHDDNLYFFGTGGIYKIEGGRSRPRNISAGTLPKLVSNWAFSQATEKIVLSFNPIKMGILISKTTTDGGSNVNYWYSLLTGGFYPITLPDECGIFSYVHYNADTGSYRATLYGCNDGYIRHFLDTAKDDDVGAADKAISSYMTLPAFPLGDGFDVEGKILQLLFVSGGGAATGDYSDTDGFSYDVHVADDAETCIEDVIDLATANLTGTIAGTGRKARVRQKTRGQYGTIKIYNTISTETFAINKVLIERQQVGRLKG